MRPISINAVAETTAPAITRHSRPASMATGSISASCGFRIRQPSISPAANFRSPCSRASPPRNRAAVRNPFWPIAAVAKIAGKASGSQPGLRREAARGDGVERQRAERPDDHGQRKRQRGEGQENQEESGSVRKRHLGGARERRDLDLGGVERGIVVGERRRSSQGELGRAPEAHEIAAAGLQPVADELDAADGQDDQGKRVADAPIGRERVGRCLKCRLVHTLGVNDDG